MCQPSTVLEFLRVFFLWTTVPGTYSQRECNHLCSYTWPCGNNQSGTKGSGCRCMFWVKPRILCVLHVPDGRDTSSPCHSRLFLPLTISPTSAASIWAVFCRPTDLLQGPITLPLSWLLRNSVGRTQGNGFPVFQLTEPAESMLD